MYFVIVGDFNINKFEKPHSVINHVEAQDIFFKKNSSNIRCLIIDGSSCKVEEGTIWTAVE